MIFYAAIAVFYAISNTFFGKEPVEPGQGDVTRVAFHGARDDGPPDGAEPGRGGP